MPETPGLRMALFSMFSSPSIPWIVVARALALLPVLMLLLPLLLAIKPSWIDRPAIAGRLADIRTGAHEGFTRVVLDLENAAGTGESGEPGEPGGPGEPALERLASGNGWAVLLPGFCPETSSRLLYPPQPDLASVATGCDGSLLRVEIRTRADCEAQMQIVPPRDGKPLRCVVDLYPSGEPGQGQAGSAEAGAHGAASPPSSPQPAVPAAPVVAEPLPRKTGPWRILIDPGHGGHDPGAQRKGIREKEVVLDVARRLEKILDGTPDFEAKLTRADDRFVGLVQRRKEAETYQADAFISIHVNAAKASKAIGVEVFFLSLRGASDQASSELARLENEADPDWVVEEDSQLQDLPFGFDLRQSDTILRSSRLAEAVLDRLDRSNLAASRGVKQAGFAVLKSFQVPSILVETGFLSNPGEAKRLQDPAHRQKLAECIAQGTIEYFQHSARSRAAASESDP